MTFTLPDGSTMELDKPKEAPKMSRAERRRMMRDPLMTQKAIAGNEYVDEYARLLAFGQILINDMFSIQMKMNGLGFTPKEFRAERQESLTNEWNEKVEKLQNCQKRMEEIEAEKKKEEEKPQKNLIEMPV